MAPEDVLAYCLQEIESGRKSIAECVALFPEAPDLEAQLLAAQKLKNWSAPLMRPPASQRIEANLRGQVWAQRRARTTLLARASQKFTPAMRWAIVAALLLALFLASTGAVTASANSLPGEFLYSLKRTSEAVGLALTRPEDRSAYHLKLAQNRLDELSSLIARGDADPALITSLNSEIIAQTESAISTVNEAPVDIQPQLWQQILAETERQQSTLQMLQDQVPPEVQATLESALDESAQHSSTAQEAIDDTAVAPVTATVVATPPPAPGLPPPVPSQPSSITAAPVEPTALPPTAMPAQPTLSLPSATPAGPSANSPAAASTPPNTAQPPSGTNAIPAHTHPAPNTHAAAPANTDTAPTATDDDGGESGHAPNCNANNPNSPNYCTDTPQPTTAAINQPADSTSAPTTTPTACPTNPGGQPKCKP
jgi:hypothetical protein